MSESFQITKKMERDLEKAANDLKNGRFIVFDTVDELIAHLNAIPQKGRVYA